MRIKPGLFAVAAATMIAGVSGCAAGSGTGSTVSPSTSISSSSTPMTSGMSMPPGAPPMSSSPAAKTPSAAQVLITIKDYKFTFPASVAPGAKVMVKNEDPVNHTVTSATHLFDVTATAGGANVSFTAPTKPGSYPFMCTFHANMTGTLVVK